MERKIKSGMLRIVAVIFLCILGSGLLFSAGALADGHGKNKINFEHGDQHPLPFTERECKGNEGAGQVSAWLLILANFTIAFSILARWINRFGPLGPESKKTLTQLNRFQKKYLMGLHYYLNPVAGVIALYHWLTSCCRITALPEWGLLMLIIMILLGSIMKWKLLSKPLQKISYQIHTQPAIFIAMILVLTAGHEMLD